MPTFVDVEVEPGPAAEDGVSMRWKQIDALRPIVELDYESDDGVVGAWRVVGVDDDDVRVPARAARVEDSSDGEVFLVVGGRHGLLLEHPSGARERQPYLLLSRSTRIV